MEERKIITWSDSDIERVAYAFCEKCEKEDMNVTFRMRDPNTKKLRPYKISKYYLYNSNGKQLKPTAYLDGSAYQLTFLESGDVVYKHIETTTEPVEIVGFSTTGEPFDKYGNFYTIINEYKDFDFFSWLKSDAGGGTHKKLFAFVSDGIVFEFTSGSSALKYVHVDRGYPLDYIECVNDLLDHQITRSTTPMELIKEINYAYERRCKIKENIIPWVGVNKTVPNSITSPTTEETYRLQLEEELMTRIPSVCIQSSDCHGLALLRYALDYPELFEELKDEFKKY